MADLGPGDFFGEMGLLEKTLRNATVTAKTPMRLVTLTGWDLKRMERTMPEAIERGAQRRSKSAGPELSGWPARIVLFGATGYTGRLAAEAMVERGLKPGAGGAQRRTSSTRWPASSAAGSRPPTADVSDPPSVRALVESGRRAGDAPSARSCAGARPAAAAATTAGAHYLDSTGEPPFIREVFERYGAGRRAGRHRDAHRVRLRLGAGQPRRRRSRSSAPASWPRAWTSATSSPAAAAR